jgi:hypothetical protein
MPTRMTRIMSPSLLSSSRLSQSPLAGGVTSLGTDKGIQRQCTSSNVAHARNARRTTKRMPCSPTPQKNLEPKISCILVGQAQCAQALRGIVLDLGQQFLLLVVGERDRLAGLVELLCAEPQDNLAGALHVHPVAVACRKAAWFK